MTVIVENNWQPQFLESDFSRVGRLGVVIYVGPCDFSGENGPSTSWMFVGADWNSAVVDIIKEALYFKSLGC